MQMEINTMQSHAELTLDSSYKEIFEKLSELNTNQICDALGKDVRAMKEVHAVIGVGDTDKYIGRAYTVKSNQDSLSTMQALSDYESFLAFLKIPSTDIVPIILTIASCGAKTALVGGNCALTAKKAGFSAIVTDGYYRDTNEVKATNLPLFAQGKCPNSGSKTKVGEIKVPIECGKVEVKPGDILFADIDGVVVMDKSEAITAISKGENIKLTESIFFDKVNSGSKLNELCNIDEHVKNIKADIPSTLKFTF